MQLSYQGKTSLSWTSTKSTIRENRAEVGLTEYYNDNKNKFMHRLYKGPPTLFRWLAWFVSSGVSINRSPLAYQYLLKQNIDQDIETQIDKDVTRTISDTTLNTKEAQNMLYRMLKAFTVLDPEVGYCLGINFLAWFIYQQCNLDEIEAFYFLTTLFENEYKFGLRGFFMNEFPSLKMYVSIFNKYFKSLLPKLYTHFEEIGLPDECWINKWFQTLFVHCLSGRAILRIWDCILSSGYSFMINIAVGLLSLLETQLLEQSDLVDVTEFFKRLNPRHYNIKESEEIMIDAEVLLEVANKLKISKEELEILFNEYENTTPGYNKPSSVEYALEQYELKFVSDYEASSMGSKQSSSKELTNISGIIDLNNDMSPFFNNRTGVDGCDNDLQFYPKQVIGNKDYESNGSNIAYPSIETEHVPAANIGHLKNPVNVLKLENPFINSERQEATQFGAKNNLIDQIEDI